jgi:DNA gyrase subunit A
MGNYHPHGDVAIYDTLVRMAQPFNMRAMQVDGQGNFGSVDGDLARGDALHRGPAHPARRADDGGHREGDGRLPAHLRRQLDRALGAADAFPNLLVNGSSGIAVGMATNIPPHNLGEVTEALLFLLDSAGPDRRRALEGVMARIAGPDFPTAGSSVAAPGSGRLSHRARDRHHARPRRDRDRKGDRESIVISEIPFQVNKSRLIERIADLVRDKKLEGISDVRDESDRRGMRVVVDLKKGEIAQVVLNKLYEHTQLQDSFGIIMLAIVDSARGC